MAMDSNVNDPGNVEEVNNGYSRAVILLLTRWFLDQSKGRAEKTKVNDNW